MYIQTFRFRKNWFFGGMIGVFLLLALALLLIMGGERAAFAPKEPFPYSKAGTAQERLDLLSEMGWEVEREPLRIQEVIIPTVFDGVYDDYNALQKKAGFDLEPYRGKRAKLYVYELLNGANAPEDPVQLSFLIYKNKVIGGDISSARLDGFMRELYPKA